MNWIQLNSQEQLKHIVEDDSKKCFAIFKHSTRCSISSAAKNRIENSWESSNPDIPIYYLDLLSERELSNKVTEIFDVEHQSPQLLIIKNGECIYNASHLSISPKDIANHIA